MKRLMMPCISAVCVMLAGVTAMAQETRPVSEDASSAVSAPTLGTGLSELVADKLEFGTRFTHSQLLKENTRNRFVGSINQLQTKNDYSLPGNLFVVYKLTPEWGLDLSWDSIRAAGNSHYPPDDFGTDGDFVLKGPILSVIGRYPNSTRITPNAGIGLVYYFGDFDAAGYWANGFDTDSDYRMYGPESINGKIRRMYVDDAIGYDIHAGTDVRIWDRVFADLRVEYVKVETEVNFAGFINGSRVYYHGPYHVPFDHYSISLGLKYEF